MSSHARLPPARAKTVYPINGHFVVGNGSSTTAGTEDPSTVTIYTLLDTAMGGSKTPSVNEGVIGASLLGTTTGFLQGQITNSISLGRGGYTRVLQWDVPNNYSILGGPEVHRGAVCQTSLTGTNNTSNDNTNAGTLLLGVAHNLNVLDNIAASDATVISGKRFLLWCSTPNKYPDGWLFSGQGKAADMARQARLGWADYPGQSINALDYWRLENPVMPVDQLSIDNGEAGFYSMRVVNKDHLIGATLNPVTGAFDPGGGLGSLKRMFIQPFVESIEGGLPFFAFHHYYSNQSTAQTNTGYVTKFEYTGSISGCSFQILNRDRSLNADFGITINGSNVEVHRISATVLKQGYYDLILHVWNGAGDHQYYRQKLGIGSLTKANNDELTLDGYTFGYLWSIDNAGTSGSPLYTDNTSRNLRGVSSGATFSLAVRLAPSAATPDGCNMYVMATGAAVVASNRGVQIIRDTSNRLQVVLNNDSSVTWTGTLRTPINTFKQGSNAVWVLVRANGGGTARVRMAVIDDVTNNVLYDSGDLAPGQTVVQHSAPAHSANHFLIGSPDLRGVYPNTQASNTGTYVGKLARLMMWTQEIDWWQGISGYTGAGFAAMTAGTSFAGSTNLALLRDTSGTNRLTDLGTASGNIVGDGRTLTITAGATGSFSGNCTPYFALSGNAADFMKGYQYGTACALDGDEPGNAALVGGSTFEVVDRRDWQSYTSLKGMAITT